ncbi:hypothetical protein BpHYR1_030360 [Brachionus plicatilis]|uniref:Uncharacterized protein n=1 Tax=Brachionus plicatilis TaxID=10195 RepID=A0A3M7RC06_BRAPC|nr:hypothetical protein BpHYR1_030360 [Brachionus plicatilis]
MFRSLGSVMQKVPEAQDPSFRGQPSNTTKKIFSDAPTCSSTLINEVAIMKNLNKLKIIVIFRIKIEKLTNL